MYAGGYKMNVLQKLRDSTLENKWEEITNMQQEGRGVLGVVLKVKIFVAEMEQDFRIARVEHM